MAITFKKGPHIEGYYYFQVRDHTEMLLATSDFFSAGWKCLASATCIIQGEPSIKVTGDAADSWYFEIFAGSGSPTISEGTRLLTSERYTSPEQTEAAAKKFMEDAKKDGPDAPVVILS